MTQEEKIRFVTKLTGSICNELCGKIRDGRIPAEWDGHELRELLAEKFAAETSDVMKNKRSPRYKAYRNTVLTNNLSRM